MEKLEKIIVETYKLVVVLDKYCENEKNIEEILFMEPILRTIVENLDKSIYLLKNSELNSNPSRK